MSHVLKVIWMAAKETPRGFFAPVIGAVKGILEEFRRLEKDRESKKI
ncbi:hypothetical protein [Undibacterium terreum]|uniref:Uncharacterized protein n=1 Tax=Undibacterium terreum TaxID=1224302 RepID=A0A916UQG4_9BURK|nr:hypothetical protein [Undibacterium terreum]GGC83288.1 hypothetical protein GCM10011396_33360 [Undibacterium terreum]